MWEIISDFFIKSPLIDKLAVLFGIIYVILAARNHIACWFFGILGSLLTMYSVFFYYSLYLDTFLNGFYVVAGIWGWINWHRQAGKEVKITRISPFLHLRLIGMGLALTLLFGYFFDNYTTAASTYLDAFVTVFALIAMTLTARRVLENWFYWMVIDSSSIYLYSSRGGYFFVLLFSVYVIMAIVGYLKWRKEYLNPTIS